MSGPNVTIERRNPLTPLTDTELRAIKAPVTGRLVVRDPACRGLALRISAPSQRHPSGGRSWSLEVKVNHAQRRFTIGPYPEISLAEARKRAGALRAKALDGHDPIRERREAARLARQEVADRRRGVPDARTVSTLLDTFERLAVPERKLRSWPAQRRMIEVHLADLLGRDPTSLTKIDLMAVIDAGTRGEKGAVAAKRAVRYWQTVVRWAVEDRGILPRDMVMLRLRSGEKGGGAGVAERERQRILGDDEIRAMWKASLGAGLFGDLARLFLMTGLRREELAAVKDTDIDGDVLLIGDTKTGQPHRLPLSAAALAIIRRQPRHRGQGHVFTSATGTPIAGNATNWHRERLRLQAASGTSGWSWHDLRRSHRTLLARIGVDDLVAELILDHALPGKLRKTYNLWKYQDEMREALERLAAFLDEIIAGRPNVVALPPRRAAG